MSSVVICGTRPPILPETDERYRTVLLPLVDFVQEHGFCIDNVICGGARGGDALGALWSMRVLHKPVLLQPARWGDLSYPDADIRRNRNGALYDHNAGYRRNFLMSLYLYRLVQQTQGEGAVLAMWDGESQGTADMIEAGRYFGHQIYIYNFITREMSFEYGGTVGQRGNPRIKMVRGVFEGFSGGGEIMLTNETKE
jgi:hypothetical protein